MSQVWVMFSSGPSKILILLNRYCCEACPRNKTRNTHFWTRFFSLWSFLWRVASLVLTSSMWHMMISAMLDPTPTISGRSCVSEVKHLQCNNTWQRVDFWIILNMSYWNFYRGIQKLSHQPPLPLPSRYKVITHCLTVDMIFGEK